MLQDDGTLLHLLNAARQSLAFMAGAEEVWRTVSFDLPDLIRDLERLRSLPPAPRSACAPRSSPSGRDPGFARVERLAPPLTVGVPPWAQLCASCISTRWPVPDAPPRPGRCR